MTAERRNRPSGGTRAASKSTATDYLKSSGDYRHQTPTVDERREELLLNELRRLGYGVTVPCVDCGHALTASASLVRHVGPRCLARRQVVSE